MTTDVQRVTAADLTPARVFNIIRNINDPEHPKTLEQLDVVQERLINCSDNYVNITFTPTIPHCSMATLIGLCIRVKLERELDRGIKFDVAVTPGTHSQEDQVTKQLRDKERVFAALENPSLMTMVEKCIEINELNNPVFFNPNASCGNSTGLKPDEQPAHEEDGGCCGGHGHGSGHGHDHGEQGGECCGGNGQKSDGGQCCQDEKQSQKEHGQVDGDECCGGSGAAGDSCCQNK